MFRKILYPTDFSENSVRAMAYAVKMSQANNAELIILYTYRLINNGDSDDVSHRNNLAEMGRSEFEKVDNGFLKSSGVNYSFLSEVGFIVDRILANTIENKVDLVILCDDVNKKIEHKSEKGQQKLLKRIGCPVMLVPEDMPGEERPTVSSNGRAHVDSKN